MPLLALNSIAEIFRKLKKKLSYLLSYINKYTYESIDMYVLHFQQDRPHDQVDQDLQLYINLRI